MKRSDVFNLKYPTPLDHYLYPMFDQFNELKQEIAINWRTEVANGMLGERHYRDIHDVRLEITRDGTAIIRLKPEIGFDTEDELKSYTQLFHTYKTISTELTNLLESYFEDREIYRVERCVLDSKYLVESYDKPWRKQNKHMVHKLVMTLKILVSAVNFNRLDYSDLYRFTDVLGSDQDSFVASMNELVKEYGFAHLLSDQFALGKAHFYQYPDAELVKAYWDREARLELKRA